MMKRSRWNRIVRATMATAVGGSAFALSGCDPEVRTTLLSGLAQTSTGLTTALITAFFQGLDNDNGTTSGGNTTTSL